MPRPTTLLAALALATAAAPSASAQDLPLREGDRVVLVGGLLAERQQHDGWLETRLQLAFPDLGLSFRNLGFSADTLTVRQRTDGFGTPDEWLARAHADVVFGFWGFNESFDGDAGLERFRGELSAWVEHVRGLTNDDGAPLRVVLFSSVPFANPGNASLPDGDALNARLASYDAVQAEVARALGVPFVDLATPLHTRQARGAAGLTIDGVHLTSAGNEVLADAVAHAFGVDEHPERALQEAVRALVREKNELWFNRYQATDGYNVYGGRSSLAYDGVTNFEVLQRELTVLDALCDRLDIDLRAVARGEVRPPAPVIGEGTIPPLIEVATNLPGEGPGGAHVYLGGQEAIAEMTPAAGTRVELFADEARFRELANPVQMSFDARGRLWVAVWPTYPHWQPGQPRNDKLLVFEDADGDGRADGVQAFADDLHNPTGFEFWGGGVLVANPPDVLFLKDSDGDGRADVRERFVHGLSSGDTHHSANTFVLGPDGALYFQEGIFHHSQVETVYGPVRNHNASAWRFDPRSFRVERYVPYDFLNPHGHVFDRWGQDFVTDGTTNENFWVAPMSGFLPEPLKHARSFTFFDQRSRPAAATEILSSRHFPAANQGNYLIANVIGFRGIFQYAFEDAGSGFGAREVEPLVFSADPNFRPVDIEVGPDGAVWFLDWHNALIGHMQHHLRDPSRDHEHGRVYRVVAEGRPLLVPEDLSALPTPELVARLASPEDRVRYRARGALSARPGDEVQAAVRAWSASFSADEAELEHHLLEALWALQQHDLDEVELLERVLTSPDPRARAAAVRVVRGRRSTLDDPLALLARAVRDGHPRVRLEAVVACSALDSARAAAVAVQALAQPTDRFLDYALAETVRALEPRWRPALAAGEALVRDDPRALAYLLSRLDDGELEALTPDAFGDAAPALWEERLSRPGLDADGVHAGLIALARLLGSTPDAELLRAIRSADARDDAHADHRLMGLFAAVGLLAPAERARLVEPLRALAHDGVRDSTRRLALRGRMQAEGAVAPTWDEAAADARDLLELLDALRLVDDAALAVPLYERAAALLAAPATADAASPRARFVRVELPGPARTLTLAEVEVLSGGANVAPTGSASQSTTAWGAVAARAIDGNASPRFADQGQTHTIEDRSEPWWELDLGRELPVDAVVLHNRGEEGGQFAARLDGARVQLLDAERRRVFDAELAKAPVDSTRLDVAGAAAQVRPRALRALASLAGPAGREDEAARELAARFDDDALRPYVVTACSDLPCARWPTDARSRVAASLTTRFEAAAGSAFDGADQRALLAFADELAAALPPADAQALRLARRPLGPQVIVLRSVPDSLQYDRARFRVVAGRPVELVFDNVDIMPHNLVVTAPGALTTVGRAADRMASDPEAAERGYVPELAAVLQATRLLRPGESQRLSFDAPETPDDYPYVCTFPGHWLRMNGVMEVVASYDELEAPAAPEPVAAAAPTRAFVREWSFDELSGALAAVAERDPAPGRAVLEAASCLRCHAVGGEGGSTGPALEDVAARRSLSELLAHVLEPSLEIDPAYQNEMFFLLDGTLRAGRVLREEAGRAWVQEDPYSQAEPVEVALDQVEERATSNLSTMPSGLLSTFQRDEILDLLAYLRSLAPERKTP